MSSDSLVKVLLRIGLEAVQPALVACLFAKIPEYFDGDDNDGRLADSIPRLVLAQFKFLEVNMPESKVTSQLLDLIDVAPIHIKREAIAIIPDVAVDEEHTEVVDRLRHNSTATHSAPTRCWTHFPILHLTTCFSPMWQTK